MDERERFEAWWHGSDTESSLPTAPSHYHPDHENLAWDAWQAAIARERPAGWVRMDERAPEMPADGSEIEVWTFDGEHVQADEWGTWTEQPAGPCVGGSVEFGPDFLCNHNAHYVTHWMLRKPPPPPASPADGEGK